jgi:hypothetical protein
MQERYKFDDVLTRLQDCLKESGFDAQRKSSEHEGVLFARKEIDGECIRIVTHVTDSVVQRTNTGGPDAELRSARATQVAIRPSLASQTASRYAPGEYQQSEPCD